MSKSDNNQNNKKQAKRDWKQIKGALRMVVIIAEVYAAATLLLVIDADIAMKVVSAVLAVDVLVELTKRFTK